MTEQEETTALADEIAKALKESGQLFMAETRAYIETNRTYNSKTDFHKAHSKSIAQMVAEHLISLGYHRDNIVGDGAFDVPFNDPDAHSCREHMNADGICTWCGAIVHGTSADYSLHGYDPPDTF